MRVEITAPYEFSGQLITSITKRYGVITNTEESAGYVMLKAEVNHERIPYIACSNEFSCFSKVPMNDMFGYSTELRTMTQGKGEYTMEFSRYTPCRGDVQEKLCRQYVAQNEEAEKQANKQ